MEKLYEPRFQHIFFLVPFYTGTNPRVIPVYESSLYFQSYFAQGYKSFYRPEFTHYLFIGDDLILNPAVNERNYAQLLRLDAKSSYLPDLRPLHEPAPSLFLSQDSHPAGANWAHTFRGITFFENRKGSQAQAELPTYEEALQQFAAHGVRIRPLAYYNIFGPVTFPGSVQDAIETGKNLWRYYVTWRRFKVPGHAQQLKLEYPLAYSYSDIAVVSAPAIERFCHLCGVLAAMGLFVEMAVPTALLLSGGPILTDAAAGLRGKALWEWTGDVAALEEKYALNLDALLADFAADQLYYHPIKLSRWKRAKKSINPDDTLVVPAAKVTPPLS
ncbi:MAG: hypothetical protein EOO61_10240 [Hymenobacter sp.]|nr:MAG: hypothetical protein EOO61_10240 [Hymenobacter sp.]